MASYRGYKGRIEVQTDGVSGSGGYNALTLVGDANLSMNRSADIRPRRGTEFKTKLAGQIEATITAEITWDDADTVVAALEAAFIAGSHVGMKFLDNASGTGLTADVLVTGWEHSHPDGTQTVSATFELTYVDTDPAWA